MSLYCTILIVNINIIKI